MSKIIQTCAVCGKPFSHYASEKRTTCSNPCKIHLVLEQKNKFTSFKKDMSQVKPPRTVSPLTVDDLY